MNIERAGLLAGEQEHQGGGGGGGGWVSADDEVVEVVGHGAHQGEEMKRSIGALRLTVMAYFLISGGPFSIESIVGAAGPLVAIIGLLAVPFIWSIPQAIMSAELSLMMSENGGNIVWVQRAFGDFIGWINAYNIISANFTTLAMYPLLFIAYLPVQLNWWEAMLVQVGFLAVVVIINIIGVDFLSRLSLAILFVILLPFIIEVVAIPVEGYFEPRAVLDTRKFGDIDWALFISVIIWNLDGFDIMGAMAGEVEGGRSTYIRGIVSSVPLLWATYVVPVVLGYWVVPNYHLWQEGFFQDIADKVAPWLGVMMTVAAAVSNFGMANALIATLARTCWAMALEEGKAQKLPRPVAWSWKKSDGEVVPVAALLLVGVICCFLARVPFNELAEVTTLMRIVNVSLQYASLFALRFFEPGTLRPFEVPGGKVGVFLLAVPPLALAGFLLYHSSLRTLGIAGLANLVIIGLYLLHWLILHLRTRLADRHRRHPTSSFLVIDTDIN